MRLMSREPRAALAAILFLGSALGSASAAADADGVEFPVFGLGYVACSEYLADVARDPAIRTLYDGWLDGFVAELAEATPGLAEFQQDSERSDARAHIDSLCHEQGTLTYIAAAVSFLKGRERPKQMGRS